MPNSDHGLGEESGRNEASSSTLADAESYSLKYAIVIDWDATSYGAHVPDLPGCVAAAETKAEVCALIREAIELYIEAVEEDAQPVPTPQVYELAEV